MKTRGIVSLVLGMSFYLGGVMAQQVTDPLSHPWVKIADPVTGLEASFPQSPIEMTYDLPFTNTPPTGQLHLYSSPVPHGVLVSGILVSSTVTADWLQEKNFKNFFNSIVVPRLFYYPKVFKQNQSFQVQSNKDLLTFDVTYQDHQTTKQMNGKALVKNHMIYFAFYLASQQTFDPQLLDYFMQSIHVNPSK